MTRLAIVYHSVKNRTAEIAQQVESGAKHVAGTHVDVMSVDAIDWDVLEKADAIIFGSPTYMGSVSAQFKQFMDDSSAVWMRAGWKDKLAGAFVTSYGYSGDKLNVLMQLAVYAAQHGMIWVGAAEPLQGNKPQDINRLGSFMGVMAQSDGSLDDVDPPSGDRLTAYHFGIRMAHMAARFNK